MTGKTNQRIGQALGLSEMEVEQHLTAVMARLDATSRMEAAVRAVQEGLM